MPKPNLELPTAYELFDRPRPARPPHPAIPKGEQLPAMEIAHREWARLLMNTCFFNPPIADVEIESYAKLYNITFREAEFELRRLRI